MKTQQQLITFIIVGGFNTLFGYSIYAFFLFMGLRYSIALWLAMSLGIVFNFKTMGKIVFGNRSNDSFFKFIAVYVVTYFFNMALIQLMLLVTNNLYLAGSVAMLPAAAVAFVLNKFFVFNETYEFK